MNPEHNHPSALGFQRTRFSNPVSGRGHPKSGLWPLASGFWPLSSALWLLLAGLWLLTGAGCSLMEAKADATRLYLLTAAIGPTRVVAGDAAPKRISLGLRRVELPGYLRQPSIVLRPGGTEVRTAPAARWGEALEQGVVRVLKLALASQPQVRSVIVYPAPAAEEPEFDVTVTVLACEGIQTSAGNRAHFAADWELHSTGSGATQIAQGHFEPPAADWNGSDYAALTASLGEAVSALAGEIAAALPK